MGDRTKPRAQEPSADLRGAAVDASAPYNSGKCGKW